MAKELNQKYPRCIDGENHCPPEDVGGTTGYRHFLKIIQNPTHPEYQDMITWVGGQFDPHRFDAQRVQFDSPRKRLLIALSDE